MLFVRSAPGVRSMSSRLMSVVGVKLSVVTTAGVPETRTFSLAEAICS